MRIWKEKWIFQHNDELNCKITLIRETLTSLHNVGIMKTSRISDE